MSIARAASRAVKAVKNQTRGMLGNRGKDGSLLSKREMEDAMDEALTVDYFPSGITDTNIGIKALEGMELPSLKSLLSELKKELAEKEEIMKLDREGIEQAGPDFDGEPHKTRRNIETVEDKIAELEGREVDGSMVGG